MSETFTGCGHDLLEGRRDRHFCSNACRQRAYRERKRELAFEGKVFTAFVFFLGPEMALGFLRITASRNADLIASRNGEVAA
jgi:predicted nucleic acid-binding Zn ribbon protein